MDGFPLALVCGFGVSLSYIRIKKVKFEYWETRMKKTALAISSFR